MPLAIGNSAAPPFLSGGGFSPWQVPNIVAAYHWSEVTLAGAVVSSWTDTVGANHMVNVNPANRPTWNEPGRSLDFDATDTLAHAGYAMPGTMTEIIRCTASTLANGYLLNTGGYALISRFVGNLVEYFWVARQTFTAAPGAGFHQFAWSHSDVGFDLVGWTDGAPAFGPVADFIALAGRTGLRVSAANAGPANPAANRIHSVFRYSRRLTDLEIALIHAWQETH